MYKVMIWSPKKLSIPFKKKLTTYPGLMSWLKPFNKIKKATPIAKIYFFNTFKKSPNAKVPVPIIPITPVSNNNDWSLVDTHRCSWYFVTNSELGGSSEPSCFAMRTSLQFELQSSIIIIILSLVYRYLYIPIFFPVLQIYLTNVLYSSSVNINKIFPTNLH